MDISKYSLSENSIHILDYTSKSFILIGAKTKDIKDKLKELGGKYNPHLTHPETKDKISGWIFSNKHKEKVQAFIEGKPLDSPSMDQRLGLNGNVDVKKRSPGSGTPATNTESCQRSGGLCPTESEVILISNGIETPDIIDIPGFSMIAPKVGMKVKMLQGDEEFILEIKSISKNSDGYPFQFRASNDDTSFNFVMVGKEWKQLLAQDVEKIIFE
jgi:hypothetical protein